MTILNNRYEVLNKLGAGGMAEVYRAMQLQLDREVAIKFIAPNVTGGTFRARFEREAKAVAKLNHPNIVQVIDFDQAEDGRFYMVMELLRGQDLSQHIETHRFSLPEAVEIVRQVALALQFAHAHDIIHRDIKPQNIFLTNDNRIKVADFGLVKMANAGDLTGSDMVVGTPYYFAPEQGGGMEIDHRVDLYALGVVFFQLVTGILPYKGDTPLSTLAMHLNAPIPDPRAGREDLPPIITDIIQKLLAKKPEERYPDAATLITDLEVLLQEADLNGATVVFTNLPSQTAANTPVFTEAARTRQDISSAETKLLSSQTVVSRNRRSFLMGGVLLIVAIVVIGALALMSGGGDKQEKDQASDTFAVNLNFDPATEDEYLVLVADFVNEAGAGVDVSTRLANAFETGNVAFMLGNNFRLATSDQQLTSEAQAQELGQAANALLVVWGGYDSSGLQVNVSAPLYPEDTMNHLSFLVPTGDDFGSIVAEDMPLYASFYARSLAIQQLLLDERATALVTVLSTWKEEVTTSEFRIVPSTALDRYILEAIISLVTDDPIGADTSTTRALGLVPNDPALSFWRYMVNGMFLNRIDRAQADVNQLYESLPNNDTPLFADAFLAFLQADYPRYVDLTAGLAPENKEMSITLFAYRSLSLIALGDFGTAFQESLAWENSLAEEQQQQTIVLIGLEPVLAMLYDMRGDDAGLAAQLENLSGSRVSDLASESMTMFTSMNTIPSTLMVFGGYIAEVDDNALFARIAYNQGLASDPTNFLINWRLGAMSEDSGDYQAAYDFYTVASENAPVPFPIADYRRGVVTAEHLGGDGCEMFSAGLEAANTNAEFYAPLIEILEAASETYACSAAPAIANDYRIVVAQFAGEQVTGVDAARRIASNLRTGDFAALLGDRFELVEVEDVISTSQEANALAAQQGAYMVVWGVQDAAGVEVVLHVTGYPDGSLEELRFTVPNNDNFVSLINEDMPIAVNVYAQVLSIQRLVQDSDPMALVNVTANWEDALKDRALGIIPSTRLEQRILDMVKSFVDGDMDASDGAVSEALLIVPDDIGLLFWRWSLNESFMGRTERAQPDFEKLQASPNANTDMLVFLQAFAAILRGDDSTTLALTEDLELRGTMASIGSAYYRVLALVAQGKFEESLAHANEIAEFVEVNTVVVVAEFRIEALRALIFEIQGDVEAAQADLTVMQQTRFFDAVENMYSGMAQVTNFSPTGSVMIFTGYTLEHSDTPTMSLLVYQAGLAADPNSFVLNWRRGKLFANSEDFQNAATHYETAFQHAPAPFPIAAYDLGMLLTDHPEIESDLTACEAFRQAADLAESNPEFYAILIGKIQAGQGEAGCMN